MTINPQQLSPDCLVCPADCPFLGMRTFLPNTLPFYCNKYETFLGAFSGQKVRRENRCRGVVQDIVSLGLSFIEAYPGPSDIETRDAFLSLNKNMKKMFVELIASTGSVVRLSGGEGNKKEELTDAILFKWKEMKDKAGSPEAKAFRDELDSLGDSLMTRQTKTLLMNLFMVMDKSEKDMMKNILMNPKQIKSFLNVFEKQPQDQDLLKNVRALVYNYAERAKEERLRQQRDQFRLRETMRQQERQQQELQRLMRLNQRKNMKGLVR